MKKFKYSLEQILNFRETEKEQYRQKLLNAAEKVKDEESRINQLKKAIDDCQHQETVGSPIEFLRNREQYIRRLTLERRDHQQLLNELKNLEDDARNELIEASREVQKMQKVKDKEFLTWQGEMKREEQFILDETGTARAYKQSQEHEDN